MTVAVYLKSKILWENGSLETVIRRLSEANKNVAFILLSPHFRRNEQTKDRIKILSVHPVFASFGFSKFAFKYFLPAILQKYGVTHFISEALFLPPKNEIKYYWYVSSLHYNADVLKKYNARHLQTMCTAMDGIAATDDAIIAALKPYQADASFSIRNIGMPMDFIPPALLTNGEAQQLCIFCKAEGLHLNEVITVIKAFSIFKKRTKSSATMQLMVDEKQLAPITKKLGAYKYKQAVELSANDVIAMYKNNNVLACICLDEFPFIPFVLQMLFASQSVIVRDGNNRLLFKDAVLYTSYNEKDLADALILLYNNEYVGSALHLKSAELTSWHQIDNTANNLWHLLEGSAADGPA